MVDLATVGEFHTAEKFVGEVERVLRVRALLLLGLAKIIDTMD